MFASIRAAKFAGWSSALRPSVLSFPSLQQARDGRIICGQARVAAAEKLNLAEIPVIPLEHLSDEQIKALSVADNRLGELAPGISEL